MKKELVFLNLYHNIFFKKIVLIFICTLLTLFFLDGKHYIECKHILLDEIMDFPCCLSSEHEENIVLKLAKNYLFFECHEKDNSFVNVLFVKVTDIFMYPFFQKGLKEKLFSLKRYLS